MKTTPIELFKTWWNEELNVTQVSIPTACCLSTNGTDGFPNARFVSLKGFLEDKLIVTGNIFSRKGVEINLSNKVALTFWWTETERQVRVQGTAAPLSTELANKYFAERSRDSQVVSLTSNQGQQLVDIEALNKKYHEIDSTFANQPLKRPENWGGYEIAPIRIEFLAFEQTRFHSRKLFELTNGNWTETLLQP